MRRGFAPNKNNIMAKIIGITGKKRSGKDTAAEFLSKYLKGKCQRLAFADPLKEEVAEALDVSFEYLEKNKDSFRPLLQFWGTEWRRNRCGSDYWLRRMEERIAASDADFILIPDVRFKNEADFVRRLDGHNLRVLRPTDNTDSHASENELDDYPVDFVLDNFDSLAQLEVQARVMAIYFNTLPK
jgi:phosphomevalonate kinase